MNQSINTDSKNSKEPQQKYQALSGKWKFCKHFLKLICFQASIVELFFFYKILKVKFE